MTTSDSAYVWAWLPGAVEPIVVGASGMGVGRVELDARGYRYVQHKNKFGQEYTSASGDRY